MNQTVANKSSYKIKGFYIGENGVIIPDTHFHYSGVDSMIDHQRIWYAEAEKNGYQSGELDEAAIMQENYKGQLTLTQEQLLAIINDGELMNTPFDELFPTKIDAYIIQMLKSEYADLKAYVLDLENGANCSEELSRMKTIQNEIARITSHGS